MSTKTKPYPYVVKIEYEQVIYAKDSIEAKDKFINEFALKVIAYSGNYQELMKVFTVKVM